MTLGENVETIPHYFLFDCSYVTCITLPESLTTIEDYAFCRSRLSTITIPASVTVIGDKAFTDCTTLKEIHSQNPEPPHAEKTTFSGVNVKRTVLYVPIGSAEDYSWAVGWDQFTNIEEEDVSQVSSIMEGGKPTEYYDLWGNRVTELQHGVFIMRSDDKSHKRKVFVR